MYAHTHIQCVRILLRLPSTNEWWIPLCRVRLQLWRPTLATSLCGGLAVIMPCLTAAVKADPTNIPLWWARCHYAMSDCSCEGRPDQHPSVVGSLSLCHVWLQLWRRTRPTSLCGGLAVIMSCLDTAVKADPTNIPLWWARWHYVVSDCSCVGRPDQHPSVVGSLSLCRVWLQLWRPTRPTSLCGGLAVIMLCLTAAVKADPTNIPLWWARCHYVVSGYSCEGWPDQHPSVVGSLSLCCVWIQLWRLTRPTFLCGGLAVIMLCLTAAVKADPTNIPLWWARCHYAMSDCSCEGGPDQHPSVVGSLSLCRVYIQLWRPTRPTSLCGGLAVIMPCLTAAVKADPTNIPLWWARFHYVVSIFSCEGRPDQHPSVVGSLLLCCVWLQLWRRTRPTFPSGGLAVIMLCLTAAVKADPTNIPLWWARCHYVVSDCSCEGWPD